MSSNNITISVLYHSVVSCCYINTVSCIGVLSCKISIIYIVWSNNKCHALFECAHNILSPYNFINKYRVGEEE